MSKSENIPHCKICNKNFSSKSSLCNHNKRFHKPVVIPGDTFVIPTTATGDTHVIDNNNKSVLNCKYCNRHFNFRNNRWKHEKVCNNNVKEEENKKLQLEILKEQNMQLKEQTRLKREEARILQLKLKLEQSKTVDNITLRKLNNLLLAQNQRNNSTYNIQNNVHNNIIVNNFQIIPLGKEENIPKLLSEREKLMILNSRIKSLDKLIELVHCSKHNQFKNILINNIKDSFMYKYDEEKGIFVLSDKINVINHLIDCRMEDLELIFDEYNETNKINDTTKKSIKLFFDRINDDTTKYESTDNKEYSNFKESKYHDIKIMLFNNRDKIAKDIFLMLSDDSKINELEPITPSFPSFISDTSDVRGDCGFSATAVPRNLHEVALQPYANDNFDSSFLEEHPDDIQIQLLDDDTE